MSRAVRRIASLLLLPRGRVIQGDLNFRTLRGAAGLIRSWTGLDSGGNMTQFVTQEARCWLLQIA